MYPSFTTKHAGQAGASPVLSRKGTRPRVEAPRFSLIRYLDGNTPRPNSGALALAGEPVRPCHPRETSTQPELSAIAIAFVTAADAAWSRGFSFSSAPP